MLAWITGSHGLIGNCLVQLAPQLAPRWQVRGLTRSQLDLLDGDAVRQMFGRERPRLIIHCAALTRTPECQAQPELAHRVNVGATAGLAELAARIPFVLLSSDLVFDGRAGNYDEFAPPNPLSVYGETKVAAERIVLANPQHLVIRTSINYGTSPTRDRAFNEQMLLAWQRGETLRLFTDEFRCPIPAGATARAIWDLVNGGRTGLFHVAGSERLSRYEIGLLIAAQLRSDPQKIAAASTREYPNPPRPADTSLNCAKAQAALSVPLPRFSAWLRENPGAG